MEFKVLSQEPMVFDKDNASVGDMYMWDGNRLIYACNTFQAPKRESWIARIRNYLIKRFIKKMKP